MLRSLCSLIYLLVAALPISHSTYPQYLQIPFQVVALLNLSSLSSLFTLQGCPKVELSWWYLQIPLQLAALPSLSSLSSLFTLQTRPKVTQLVTPSDPSPSGSTPESLIPEKPIHTSDSSKSGTQLVGHTFWSPSKGQHSWVSHTWATYPSFRYSPC